uniref:Pgr5-like a isoform 1 n=1 Tax=Tetraselmis sp. GSL018 TaxID=582737 RepID=A0A061RZ43_9CHLO|mmetsp:Transcript_22892/g.54809  ORF Transcript_22892/g.54809 Transcript_22892/m.54809 type:complete len:335 (+) Transcript_22892:142-1146(+)
MQVRSLASVGTALAPRITSSRAVISNQASSINTCKSSHATLFRPKPVSCPVACAASKEDETVAAMGGQCSIDDMSGCTLGDLETMYIEALWNYYEGGNKFTDEQYDRLKEELSWQGSGFPTLKRDEIRFVKASIEHAKGNSVMSNEEYDALKEKVKSKGKRQDVTALLLYVKGQQMLEPEQYEQLRQNMTNLGIDVGMKGASCTLSDTSQNLEADLETTLLMYAALSALPFLGGSAIWWLADLAAPGNLPGVSYLAFVGLFTAALVTAIMNVAELSNPNILKGQCPCCESKVVAFFSANTADNATRKCQVCGTSVTLDRNSKKLTLVDGPSFVE